MKVQNVMVHQVLAASHHANRSVNVCHYVLTWGNHLSYYVLIAFAVEFEPYPISAY